jgi:FtsH-binding integral membrane protein
MYSQATTVNTFKTASELNTAMAGVYKNMMLAVLTSMVVSYLVSNSSTLMQLFFQTALKWVVIFAPLAAALALGFTLSKMTKTMAVVSLHGFAALMGLSMAVLFVVYTSMSIVSAFMSAAVLFGVMSFYGYFTKKNLDSLGKWLFVGLIAIVIASIINVFIGSSVAQMTISALAVIIFTGLTAYDTQRIREELSVNSEGNTEIAGALSLYLNFINLFTSLLQLFGNKEE